MYKLKLKELRKSRKISQTKFAEDLNLTPVTISRYENNQRFPDISIMIAIADYFDVPLDFLVGRSWPASNPIVQSSQPQSSAEVVPVKNDPNFNRLLMTYKALHDQYGMSLPLDELSADGREKVIDYFKLVRDSEKYNK